MDWSGIGNFYGFDVLGLQWAVSAMELQGADTLVSTSTLNTGSSTETKTRIR